MRISYLIAWRGGRRTGPFKKIAAQSAAWTDAGHEVGLFVTTSAEAVRDWSDLPETIDVRASVGGLGQSAIARRRVYRALEGWQPQIVYLRHGLYAPGLRGVARRHPMVIEVNGDEVVVARSSSAIKAAWALATRSRLLREVRGAVFMTEEQARSARFRGYRYETLVLPNGIDLQTTPALPPSTNREPRLVLLGHPDSPWHGTDKLVVLARSRPDWRFDVIGPTAADLGTAPPGNVTLHPELTEDEYLPVLAAADVGVGSLAMHRLGCSENPALKVREYLARGLPVILGCRDPDLDPTSEFVLQLPNTDHNVSEHVREIDGFVRRWVGRRVPHELIGHLDLRPKEASRLSFFARQLDDAGRIAAGGSVHP